MMVTINKPKSLFCILVLLGGGVFLVERIDQSPVSHAAAQFISHPAEPVVIEGIVDQPNIIMIIADDMGWGDLACFGNPEIFTPSLDQMAEEGTRFTQFYVQSGICTPTRVGFMTGRFPSTLDIHRGLSNHNSNKQGGQPDWLDPNLTTINDILKSAGYATGHYGKWHLGYCCGAPDPGQYGIDDHVTVNSNGPGFPDEGNGFRAVSSRHIVDEAIEFMEANLDSPFYMNLWMLLPHATLNPTPEQLEIYDHLAPPKYVRHVGARQIYYASVTAMDEQIGRLLDRLDELGLSENTLVVFTSDNGPAHPYVKATSHSGVGSSGPFRGGKQSLYEGGVRMPMIARWPGMVPAGAVDNDSVIAGVDFLPTVASLAGIDLNIPNSMWQPDYSDIGDGDSQLIQDGEDMSDALLGIPTVRTTTLFWEFRFSTANAPNQWRAPMLATRVGPWKLLMNPDLSRVELYDVVIDPKEVDNLADGYPDIVKVLSTSLMQWYESLPDGPYADDAGSDAYPWPQ